ncbi:MAG TPA: alpha-2-macroglobulin family protein, partial [Terriglobia bacterium]|nr:alpha-2-macroglobulin family protein [Terriglobia bacterium]
GRVLSSEDQAGASGSIGVHMYRTQFPGVREFRGGRVTLFDLRGRELSTGTTDNDGVLVFADLKPGYYRATIGEGDNRRFISEIPVHAGKETYLGVDAWFLNTPRANPADEVDTSSLDSAPLTGNDPLALITTLPGYRAMPLAGFNPGVEAPPETAGTPRPPAVQKPGFTPRLRQYFPETLIWRPALETHRNGRAELRFKVPDNMTEWQVVAIASTMDGRVARARTAFFSYQPFFVEHDPPRTLTEGDTIALPVTIRNYLDRDQNVDIVMKPESWFRAIDTAEQKASVRSGETVKTTFGIEAVAAVRNGLQRVTAIGASAGDSMEKPVTVHPNGREMTAIDNRVVQSKSAFDVVAPPNAVHGAISARVAIYPDQASHIAGAIEGIMERPHGCGEQVISSTYPSLMLLRFAADSGRRLGPLATTANRYLQDGYQQLKAYQSPDGGFTYWGHGEPDVALTAYAVRFLSGAREFIDIDEEAFDRAILWLAARQRADGSWSPAPGASPGAVLNLTSLVAEALSDAVVARSLRSQDRHNVADALAFARGPAGESMEPYTFAMLALAALHHGDRDMAKWALGQLERLARAEGDEASWETNGLLPFYAWGPAGEIEASALSIRALAAGLEVGLETDRTRSLIDRGLVFLFRHKDRNGVWSSMQATMRALDALSLILGQTDEDSGKGGKIDALVNGRIVQTIPLPRNGAVSAPITFDISRFLGPGSNRVEFVNTGGAAWVQMIRSWHLPWTDHAAQNSAESLVRMNVRFDRTEGQVGEMFTGTAEVNRKGAARYGMLLGEIGLPPGAEVDRESLDRALEKSSVLYRYEIGPDRIVAYFWPRGSDGGTFQFRFRARYSIDALSAPSVLYDYNNPDEQVVEPPTRFIVR